MPAEELIVQADSVRKSFGDHEVLRGVDFQVRSGEVACIIGPSGSGKSTFLRTLNGLESVDSGSLRVMGEQVGFSRRGEDYLRWSDKRYAQFRQQIGMVFQRFNLYGHLDAEENVMLSMRHVKGLSKAKAAKRAVEELERVGLAQHRHKKPHQLSGGQQQRVAIARSLAMDPALMLFDEPTSALDPELVDEVLSTMQRLALEGMTMVVVTHELGFAREVGDTLAFFDEGVVVEKGSPQDLLDKAVSERVKAFIERVRHA